MTSQVDRSIETSCVGKLHRKERICLCTKVYGVERSPQEAPRKPPTKNDTTSQIDHVIETSCVEKLHRKKEIICTKNYIQSKERSNKAQQEV